MASVMHPSQIDDYEETVMLDMDDSRVEDDSFQLQVHFTKSTVFNGDAAIAT